jgi:hypothetical protein
VSDPEAENAPEPAATEPVVDPPIVDLSALAFVLVLLLLGLAMMAAMAHR